MKLITLQAWVARHYEAGSAPSLDTVRGWIRSHKITPAPQKHGRGYYFDPDARYTAAADDDLVDRVGRDYAAHATQPASH